MYYCEARNQGQVSNLGAMINDRGSSDTMQIERKRVKGENYSRNK